MYVFIDEWRLVPIQNTIEHFPLVYTLPVIRRDFLVGFRQSIPITEFPLNVGMLSPSNHILSVVIFEGMEYHIGFQNLRGIRRIVRLL